MLLACLSPSLSAEVLVQVVKHGGPTLEVVQLVYHRLAALGYAVTLTKCAA